MKMNLRTVSVLIAVLLCMSVMAACGETTQTPSTTAPVDTTAATEASQPFVAPPDQIGLIVSADSQLFTWNPYATEDDTIDFKSVDLKKLGEAGEMALLYMEAEVSYYSLVSGKLEDATIEDVVSGSIVGVTTLEEGVQEVYILFTPVEEDEYVDEDPLENIEEETLPPETQYTDPETPEDDI